MAQVVWPDPRLLPRVARRDVHRSGRLRPEGERADPEAGEFIEPHAVRAADLGGRQRMQLQLDVGTSLPGRRPRESMHGCRRGGHEALAGDEIAEPEKHLAGRTSHDVVQRHRTPAAKGEPGMEVIPQPLSDAAQGVNGLYSETEEAVRISDPRELQDPGRVDGAGGENDLAPAADGPLRPVAAYADGGRSPVLDRDGLDRRVTQDREVAIPSEGAEIRLAHPVAEPSPRVELKIADAFVAFAVVVVVGGDPGFRAGLEERGRQRIAIRVLDDAGLSRPASQRVAAERAGFHSLEVGQHAAEVPARAPHVRPVVVLGRVPPYPEHAVDRGRASEDPPTRPEDPARLEIGVGLGPVAPHRALAGQDDSDPEGYLQPDPGVVAPRLDERDGMASFLRDTRRGGTSRRSRADHDIVECFLPRHFGRGGRPAEGLPAPSPGISPTFVAYPQNSANFAGWMFTRKTLRVFRVWARRCRCDKAHGPKERLCAAEGVADTSLDSQRTPKM